MFVNLFCTKKQHSRSFILSIVEFNYVLVFRRLENIEMIE